MAAPYPPTFKGFHSRGTFKVAPRSAPRDINGRVSRGSDHIRNFLRVQSARQVQTPNLTHFGFVQYTMRDRLAFGHLACVTAFVIGRRLAAAIALLGVESVISRRSPAQMLGVAAYWIVAGMKRVQTLFVGLPIRNNTRDARSGKLALPAMSGNGHYAIPEAVARLGYPRPAFVWSALFDFLPKTRFFGGGQFNHASAYHIARGI